MKNSFARTLCCAAVLFWVAAPDAMAVEQAGVAAGVQGNIVLAATNAAPGVVGRRAKSGEQIFIGDRVRSDADGAMQVVLLDETVFTIGPDSDLTIDEFVYDPGGGAGKVGATIGKGAFRFITGKVAQARPENMTVRTPNATIGVRGTIVYGLTSGTESVIALGGPGGDKNGSDRIGAVTVNTAQGSVNLQREGYAAVIGPSGAVDVQRLTPELKARIFGALAPPRAAAAAAAAGSVAINNAGEAAGQATAAAGIGAREVATLVAAVLQTDNNAVAASQDTRRSGSFAAAADAFTLDATVQRLTGFGSAIPQNVNLPLSLELTWANIPDLDFHLTGPNGGEGRFHIFFGARGNFGSGQFAALSNDRTGSGGSETIVINGLTPGDLYRASVFNFGNSSPNGTSLAQLSNATVRVVVNGQLQLTGAGGTVTGGTVAAIYRVPTTGVGNTWNVLSVDPATRVVAPVGTVNSAGIP